MPYTGSPPTFTSGQKTGVASSLNNLRDFARAFTDAWTSYDPVLTASTTNPTGWTQTGYYMQAGKLVIARFYVAAGGSMTAGSGTYRVALPVAANMTAQRAGVGHVSGQRRAGIGAHLSVDVRATAAARDSGLRVARGAVDVGERGLSQRHSDLRGGITWQRHFLAVSTRFRLCPARWTQPPPTRSGTRTCRTPSRRSRQSWARPLRAQLTRWRRGSQP